ncbi:trehalose-phosphatase [Verticiella sediminum]|uniref:Trehalose 6-phosphate phosphatase n=2 Tax=Verticiella sediminum TaxID=1247510 RepID=A0A556AD13_9BURK|nr:trehalose-phosphatase [Verticiella sediminum]
MDISPDSLLDLTPADAALFLDLDGTLAAFHVHPEAAFIPVPVLAAIARLAASGLPLAVVSGRPITSIDRMLAPACYPAAGVHGVERRDARGVLHMLPSEALPPAGLADALRARMAAWPGTLVEDKQVAVALHYRGAPQYEAEVEALADETAERYPYLKRQPGKFVVEFKPAGVDKGTAIAAFLSEAPFAGHTPVFLGDDRTDEAGFAVMNAHGGLSIKVGEGPTQARYRLADVAAVHAWLEKFAQRVAGPLTQHIR